MQQAAKAPPFHSGALAACRNGPVSANVRPHLADLSPIATQSQVRVRDPLSEVTRQERRALLAVSLLGITVKRTGLIPNEIEALGLKFASTDQRALLEILAVVIAYFVIAFLLYAASDFVAWRLAIRESIREALKRRRSMDPQDRESDQELHLELAHRYPLLTIRQGFVAVLSTARAIFEFALPLAFGITAIVVLLATSAA